MILTVADWLGGADNIQASKAFPSTQSTPVYNFNKDITGWTFESTNQSLVIDQLKWNKYTGEPNFSDSIVIGSFPSTPSSIQPEVLDALTGLVKLTLPADMYTGSLMPNGRVDVVLAILSMKWTQDDGNSDGQRWLVVQSWDPQTTPGDPKEEPDFIPLGV